MRLIDTRHLKFKEFLGSDIPEYAILSHCWGDDEVSYHDFLTGSKRDGLGYKKIINCCALAREQGLCWAWVDTCCIDKGSSAELSEAINSMFTWYECATICFAFLPEEIVSRQIWTGSEATWFHDCQTTGYEEVFVSLTDETFPTPFCNACFSKSRWFTRGWTLQELLAPKHILFLDHNLVEIGTKGLLANRIAKVTGIGIQYLTKRKAFHGASVACRMSWASSRLTTRVEDIAYCLLGLFDVNMPLLYGEGSKAFLRLQLQIFESIPDDSLLAWTATRTSGSQGIFALHPSDFANSKSIVPTPRRLLLPPNRMTSMGVEIHFPISWYHRPIHTKGSRWLKEITVPLACRQQDAANAPWDVITIKLSPNLTNKSRLFFRVDTGAHHTRPDSGVQLLSVFTRFRFDKIYAHPGSATSASSQLVAEATSESDAGSDRTMLVAHNVSCAAIPFFLALLDADKSLEDLSRTQAMMATWLALTLGLLGASEKLYYVSSVLVAIVVMPYSKISGAVLFCVLSYFVASAAVRKRIGPHR